MDTIITSQQPVEVIQRPARADRRAMKLAVWPVTAEREMPPTIESRPEAITSTGAAVLPDRFALLQFLLDASPQGIMLTDQDGNLVLRNASLLRLFGLPDFQGEGKGGFWIGLFASEGKDPERTRRILSLILQGQNNETLDIFELKSGRILECRTCFRMVEQIGENYRLWNFLDCTEQYRREYHLQRLSMYDPLTGLHNRAFFDSQLGGLRQLHQYPAAVIMLDVDGLKKTNDSRGHSAGDTLLCQVARILRQACRKDDVIARLGGDEFAILLAKAEPGAAEHIVDRVNGLLSLHNIHSPALPISLSMGSAVAYNEHEMRDLVARADNAMYRARRERRAH